LRAVTDPAAEREPVRAGQHQVKHDKARQLPLQKLTRGVPVARLQRRIALAPQILDDHVPDCRLVVDDQNRLHGTILPASPYKTLKSGCASHTVAYENVRGFDLRGVRLAESRAVLVPARQDGGLGSLAKTRAGVPA